MQGKVGSELWEITLNNLRELVNYRHPGPRRKRTLAPGVETASLENVLFIMNIMFVIPGGSCSNNSSPRFGSFAWTMDTRIDQNAFGYTVSNFGSIRWLHSAFWRLGSAWFLSALFKGPGSILGPGTIIWEKDSENWARLAWGGFEGNNMGDGKARFCGGMVSKLVIL